jgi:hypothetical protein
LRYTDRGGSGFDEGEKYDTRFLRVSFSGAAYFAPFGNVTVQGFSVQRFRLAFLLITFTNPEP